jgi:multiple sugar transport system permease protein
LTTQQATKVRARGFRPGLWFQLPSIGVLLGIAAFPIAYSVWLSFKSYSLVLPGKTGQWIGGENYSHLLHDAQFHGAFARTMIYTAVTVSIELVLGVLLGIALNGVKRHQRLVIALVLIPTVISPLIIGLMFNFLLNAQFGLFPYLSEHLGLPLPANVLGSNTFAFPALMLTDIWEWTPFIALITLAGLRALPTAPQEAANVDGASPWQMHRHVILPLLRPILTVAIIFRTAEAVREFDKVYILTGGGPGASTLLNDLFIYRVSFVNFDLGYGAALGVTMFLFMLCLAVVFFIAIERADRPRSRA